MALQHLAEGDPQRLGGYVLAGRLGAGGQGVVYEGYDGQGRRYAVKLLHPSADPQMRALFLREAQAARAVPSFCTAKIVDVGSDGDRLYIVSEYIPGPSLRAVVRAGRRFTGGDLHRLATGMAIALTSIHDAGVVHRDFKPDNVILGPDGPRVIDFGIARSRQMSLTPSGMIAGTPGYVAPEVYRRQRAGPSADIFAWACVVLYAATGQDAFAAARIEAIIHRVLTHAPDVSVLDAPLRSLAEAGLSKDPALRPTARRMLAALVSDDADPGLDLGVGAPIDDPELGTRAEALYQRLAEPVQHQVPGLLLRLVADEAGKNVVRPVELAELPDHPDARQVIKAFAEAGLLVADAGMVVIAHPALPYAWARLRDWLADENGALAVHQQLSAAACRWEAAGRKSGDLYHGTPLQAALDWNARGRVHMAPTKLEAEFLHAGAEAAARRSRRRRLAAGAMAVLLAVTAGTAGLYAHQRRISDNQRLTEAADRAAQAASRAFATDPVLGMRLSAAAWQLAPTREARSALYAALAQPVTDVMTAAVQPPPATNATNGPEYDLSVDGSKLAVLSGERFALWDVPGHRRLIAFDIPRKSRSNSRCSGLELSPDASMVQTCEVGLSSVLLYDVATRRRIGKSWPGRIRLFPRPGRLVAHEPFSAGNRGLIQLMDQATGRALYTHREVSFLPVAVTTNDRLIGTTSSTRGCRTRPRDFPLCPNALEIWDLPSDRLIARHDFTAVGLWAALSPDGRTIALSDGRGLSFYDADTGRELTGQRLARPGVRYLQYSRSGMLVGVDVDADGRSMAVRVWGPTGAALLYRPFSPALQPSPGTLPGVDGDRIAYLTEDGKVITLSGASSPSVDAHDQAWFSPDGQLLATFRERGRGSKLHLWTRSGGRRLAALPVMGKPVDSAESGELHVAISADGGLIAYVRDGQRTARVWDIQRRREVRRLHAPFGAGYSMAFTPDSTALAFGTVLWNVRTGKQLGQVGASVIQFGHGGRYLDDGEDLQLNRVGQTGSSQHLAGGIAMLSPDGKIVVTGDSKGVVRLYDSATARELGPVTGGHSRSVDLLAFSPDGRLLATAGRDQTIRLWDTTARQAIGGPIAINTGRLTAVSFSPDGKTLRSLSTAGVIRDHLVDPALALREVCTRARGGLSHADWQRHLPGMPFIATCRTPGP
ncbi:serine/threonine-protein kinase [Nonomuraea guangzhouensis]|uniref:Protein kinase n=1 Tax=Nonomuraea guangzhouensis TaxID=1291555 RepID=A0ABW4GFM2_9ACTN|nr:serine/threonine-protein kinase [Nonomuraea guangzhouensis]